MRIELSEKLWVQCLFGVLIVLLLPVIVACAVIAFFVWFLGIPGEIRRYKRSRYYQAFGVRYTPGIMNWKQYRFYEAAIARGLQMEYFCPEDGLEYFIYGDVAYILPDFDRIDIGEESGKWEMDFDGDWRDFAEEMHKLASRVNTGLSVKLLVERNMLPMTDLRQVTLPEQLQLVHTYETAFGEEQPLLKIPESGQELYDLMAATEDLCGTYEVADDTVFWNLGDEFSVQINVDGEREECICSIHRKTWEITHWHPSIYEIYDEVCKMGTRGNVMVVRTFIGGASIPYMGPKADCPYPEKRKWSLGKYFYLEAK